MAYTGFNGNVKRVNLKPKGVTEIVLEVPSHILDGQLNSLSSMVDSAVRVDLESIYTNYRIKVHRETERPVIDYKVDQSGVVHEVKPEGEQLEIFEGKEVPTKDEEKFAETHIVDQFIFSGLAPTYDDLDHYDFVYIMRLHLQDGVSYLKIASNYGISTGKLAADLDEYRSRVAPLAEKWWEWKQQPKVNTQMLPEDNTEETELESEMDDSNENEPTESVSDTGLADNLEDEDDKSIFKDESDVNEDDDSAGAA